MLLPPVDAGDPEPRISDIELASLMSAEPCTVQELIAESREQLAEAGNVEMDGGVYQLNRPQCLYLATALNVRLGQLALAGIEETFATSDMRHLSDANLAQILGFPDIQLFRHTVRGRFGRAGGNTKPYRLGKRQCLYLVEAWFRFLIEENTADVDAHFDSLARTPGEPNGLLPRLLH